MLLTLLCKGVGQNRIKCLSENLKNVWEDGRLPVKAGIVSADADEDKCASYLSAQNQ